MEVRNARVRSSSFVLHYGEVGTRGPGRRGDSGVSGGKGNCKGSYFIGCYRVAMKASMRETPRPFIELLSSSPCWQCPFAQDGLLADHSPVRSLCPDKAAEGRFPGFRA